MPEAEFLYLNAHHFIPIPQAGYQNAPRAKRNAQVLCLLSFV
jgi:hypothetical protein